MIPQGKRVCAWVKFLACNFEVSAKSPIHTLVSDGECPVVCWSHSLWVRTSGNRTGVRLEVGQMHDSAETARTPCSVTQGFCSEDKLASGRIKHQGSASTLLLVSQLARRPWVVSMFCVCWRKNSAKCSLKQLEEYFLLV